LACKIYHVDLVVGDTTSSVTGLVISITAIGEVEANEEVYRNTAKPGDLLCVSGNLGGAYMGLQLLEREKELFKQNPDLNPELKGYDYIIERQLKPEARIDIIRMLKEKGIKPTSMIDISDGLSSEILHICDQSLVGCKLYEKKIPIESETMKMADEFEIDPVIAALGGGEDYELLFTVKQDDYEKIITCEDITILGYITESKDGTYLITEDGSQVPIIAQGWNALQN